MMGSSTNSVYSPLLLWSQDKLNEERQKLLSCSHAEFLKFLKDDPVGVNEYDLFQAVVRWARNRISDTSTIPTVEEMKKLIAPEGKQDLMGQIRLGLFNRAEWDNLWSSKHSREVGLLPVKVFYCKADFEDMFDANEESEREKIRNLPHMKDFDFRPRGTSAVMGNCVAGEANDAPSVSADPQQSNSNSQRLLDGNGEEVPAKVVSTEPQDKQSGSGSSLAPSPPGRRLDFGQSTSLEGHFGEIEAKVVSAALQDLSGRPLPSSPGGRLDGRRGKKRSIQSSREKSLSSCNSSSASIQSMDNPNESDFCLDRGKKRVRLVVEEKGPSFSPSAVTPTGPQTFPNKPQSSHFVTDPQASTSAQYANQNPRIIDQQPLSSGSSSARISRHNMDPEIGMVQLQPILIQPKLEPDVSPDLSQTHHLNHKIGPSFSAHVNRTPNNKEPKSPTHQLITRSQSPQSADESWHRRSLRINPQPSSSLRTVLARRKHRFEPIFQTFSKYVRSINDQTERINAEFKVGLNTKHDNVGLNMNTEVGRYLPNLKEFHLKFIFAESEPCQNRLNERFIEFVEEAINLKKYLCFSKFNKLGQTESRDLWISGVNLSLEFHGCIIIKMDHSDLELVINSLKDSIKIMEGLRDIPLKKIALCCCQLTDQLNFSEVEKLTLYCVKGQTIKINDILSKCLSVVELVLCKNEAQREPVNLTNLKNPHKLKWLAICRSDISATKIDDTVFVNVETLHINSSTCSLEFLDALPKMFPNTKKLSICSILDSDGNSIDLKFVVSLLKRQNLDWIRIDDMVLNQKRNEDEFQKVYLQLTGLTTLPNSTSFILSRNADKRKWKCKNLFESQHEYFILMNEQEVEFHKLDTFYKRFSDTVPASQTYVRFNLPFVNFH